MSEANASGMNATRDGLKDDGYFGGVAQLVEQRDHNPRVGGSIPSSATINPNAKEP